MKKLLFLTTICLASTSVIKASEVRVGEIANTLKSSDIIVEGAMDMPSKDAKTTLDITEIRARKGQSGKNTALYFTLFNNTSEDIVISGADASNIASKVELHDVVNKNGVVEMKKLDKLLVPKGSKVEFKPRGLHIMLMNLKKDLIIDETFTIKLNTDKGEQELNVIVKENVETSPK